MTFGSHVYTNALSHMPYLMVINFFGGGGALSSKILIFSSHARVSWSSGTLSHCHPPPYSIYLIHYAQRSPSINLALSECFTITPFCTLITHSKLVTCLISWSHVLSHGHMSYLMVTCLISWSHVLTKISVS